MKIITVGELVDKLLKMDRDLPVLKSDACAVTYTYIELLPTTFPVKRECGPYFVDGTECNREFDAVIL